MSKGSKKAPITCQSVNCDIVIRKNKEISKDKIKSFLEQECIQYAFIEHKGDIAVDTGLVEGVHYHIVCKYKVGKIPFSTRLNTIMSYFGFDNDHGIQIDKIGSLSACLQYLIHKNNIEKTPHKIDEIIHNYDENEFKILMETENDQCVSYDWLFKGCMECNYKFELVKYFSPSIYRTWRSVILDMWDELHSSEYQSTKGRILNKEAKKLCKA